MPPLDPITRDRLIRLLTTEIEACQMQWEGNPSATILAIVALNCLETAPDLLELLHHLTKQAIKANNLIAIAQATCPDGLAPINRSTLVTYGPPSY
jgi:hypothetical protein